MSKLTDSYRVAGALCYIFIPNRARLASVHEVDDDNTGRQFLIIEPVHLGLLTRLLQLQGIQ